MTAALGSVALWALGGVLLGLWQGTVAGLAFFAAGLLLMVIVRSLHLSRVARWVRTIDAPPPPAIGPWDDILAPIYRKLKHNRLELEALQQRLHRTLLAAEALPDGALTLDADMALKWCNQTAASHLDLDLERDRGHSILNIVRAPQFVLYAGQDHWEHPLILPLNRAGRSRTLSLHMAPYGIGQFLMVTRDITQIERLENTRKDFIANVSHEMRTPLTVLAGFVETLQDMPAEALTETQRLHYLDLMAQQARNMQALVADLLTLSSLESTPNQDGSPLPVAALVRTALTQAQALSQDQHVFDVHLDDTLRICGKDTELNSALGNLLTNAVRYTPAGGTITVRWESTPEGGAAYRVQDTGIGIDPSDIPRLTERFFRVDRGRSRATGGTGLGLAITKHVALRHEATLDIQSAPGKGSTFSIVFPARRVCRPDPDSNAD